MNKLTESAYEWAKMPEDLPKKNLVLITAKTPHPTYHKEDVEHPVRLFTGQELMEASRSLAHRPVGLNHQGIIANAFTVDAQYNPSTNNVEALLFFPDEWVDKVNHLLKSGKESIFSVEYTWRDEKETMEGTEFIGLIFDKVDLLCGVNAGDKHTSARLVESALALTGRRAYCEAEVAYPSMTQETAISEAVANPSISFFKCKECGTECQEEGKCLNPSCKSNPACTSTGLQHAIECDTNGKVSVAQESDNLKGEPVSRNPEQASQNPNTILGVDNKPITKQRPNETNLLNNEPFTPVVNQDPPVVEKPIMNVMSAGFTQGTIGPEGAKNSDGPVGEAVGKEKNTFAMSGSLIPRTADDKPLVNKDEHGSLGNAETLPAYSMGKGGVGQSMGASTSESNPIPEVFKTVDIKGTGKESDNPINKGLNHVDGPDNSNEDTYNQKKGEKCLTESEKPLDKPIEKPVDKPAVAAVEIPPVAPQPQQPPAEPAIDYKAKFDETVAKLSVVDARVKELEPVIQRLQENVKTFDAEKTKIANENLHAGKQEVISKLKKMLPSSSLTNGGSFRVLVNDVRKVLKESEQ